MSEVRSAAHTPEMRTGDTERTITGYAAVFNTESVIGSQFREVIAPGAFTDAIQSSDVRALFDHDPRSLLGRMSAGTLRVAEDAVGLRYEIDVPDTSVGRDLVVLMQRGDIRGSSFSFSVDEDGQTWARGANAELPLRTIHKLASVMDVGPVTFPAYEQTTAEARSYAEAIVSAEAALAASESVVDTEQQAHDAMLIRQKRQAIVEAEL